MDLNAAQEFGIRVTHVPKYSPESIAEHSLWMALSILRHAKEGQERIKEYNFSLDGLVGSTLSGKRVGVLGVGEIGKSLVGLLQGFSCDIKGHDIIEDIAFAKANKMEYLDFVRLLNHSEILFVNLPLNELTKHVLSKDSFQHLPSKCIIVNTGRGAPIKTEELLDSLNNGRVGFAALDVYEFEEDYYFEDHSGEEIKDELLKKLIAHPNVFMTGHQAYLTNESLETISNVTFQNINDFVKNNPSGNFLV